MLRKSTSVLKLALQPTVQKRFFYNPFDPSDLNNWMNPASPFFHRHTSFFFKRKEKTPKTEIKINNQEPANKNSDANQKPKKP